MSGRSWKNIYNLSDEQLNNLNEAEDLIQMMDLTKAELLLLNMNKEAPDCVPVLNVLAHMYGRHLSDFESAIKFYNLVLEIEPDNAWARASTPSARMMLPQAPSTPMLLEFKYMNLHENSCNL